MTNDKDPRGPLALQTLAMPANANANGDIFGGWVVSLMDMAAGIEARRRAQSRVVTVAIDNLVFIRPVYVGDTVCFYANLLQVGRTSMRFKISGYALSLSDDEPRQISEGIFTFVAIDEARLPHPVDRPKSQNGFLPDGKNIDSGGE